MAKHGKTMRIHLKSEKDLKATDQSARESGSTEYLQVPLQLFSACRFSVLGAPQLCNAPLLFGVCASRPRRVSCHHLVCKDSRNSEP